MSTNSSTQQSKTGTLNPYFDEIQKECLADLENGGDGAGSKLKNTAKPFEVFKIVVTPQDVKRLSSM
jgi:hypothetical protein